MTGRGTPQRDVTTADDPDVYLCIATGTAHDWRPYAYMQHNRPWTSWRCVWCHVLACGDYGEHDPCMEPYHHHGPHRSRAGVVWPIGGDRP